MKIKIILIICFFAFSSLASAKNYSKLEGKMEDFLQESIVNLVEGDPPKTFELEKLFGFRYEKSTNYREEIQSFTSAGSYPFDEPNASRYYFYRKNENSGDYFLIIKFSSSHKSKLAYTNFCIDRNSFSKRLLDRKWLYRQWVMQPHDIDNDEFYFQSNGFLRKITLLPIKNSCIDEIQIQYNVL